MMFNLDADVNHYLYTLENYTGHHSDKKLNGVALMDVADWDGLSLHLARYITDKGRYL